MRFAAAATAAAVFVAGVMANDGYESSSSSSSSYQASSSVQSSATIDYYPSESAKPTTTSVAYYPPESSKYYSTNSSAVVSPTKKPTYVTEVVTSFVTYCPAPTSLVYNDVTYHVTEATTLTITNCPCTITKPIVTAVVTECHYCSAPSYTNATVTLAPVKPTSTVYATGSFTTTKPEFTGAANRAVAASGAGLAAVLGFAAYIL